MNDSVGHAKPVQSYPIRKFSQRQNNFLTSQTVSDSVATELPLLIRYSTNDSPDHLHNVVTLLRTPTNDYNLAAGFMFAEGYLSSPDQIEMTHFCHQDDAITLVGNQEISVFERPHITHSGCGSCALKSIENLYQTLKPVEKWFPSDELLLKILEATPPQQLFLKTGGTHASIIYDQNGEVISYDEDVGRHNALDKAIGKLWTQNTLSHAKIAWMSGRIGFELVQKCINAGIPNIISVGATTSLSIDYAKKFNLNLFAFCRENGFNLYT